MRYRIMHTTSYAYTESVTLCHNEARMTPRDGGRQQRIRSVFTIEPSPKVFRERRDYFGNRVTYFDVEAPHAELTVSVVSEVITEAEREQLDLGVGVNWESVRDQIRHGEDPELLQMRQFVIDSPLARGLPELRAFAEASFTPGRDILDGAMDLTRRIFTEFQYDPAATTVSTPLLQVLEERRGVCQDFAHLAIGALRAIGLPAGYVSGYLETLPPPGQPKLVGADASHAWFDVYVPGIGWMEFDPTNNQRPTERYVVLARGRDFGDVTPLKGVIYGGGDHTMKVSVDVQGLE